ncbi:hypothetical protein JCM8202_003459 [Rhodotorula sphaerocarpa]
MPRPTRARTSLPGHSRAAKLRPDAVVAAPDGLDDSYMMAPEEMAPIAAVKAAAAAAAVDEPSRVAESSEHDGVAEGPPREERREPKAKQTKAEKAYNKRKLLLDKLNASTTPYSKSHNRRIRRAARPQNNLVTTLQEVEAVLPSIEPAFDMPEEDDEGDESFGGSAAEEAEEDAPAAGKKGTTGGKGKEKLTAKKRQRVLTSESSRLPAIIKNESFAQSPFATIRQHTLNTLAMQKNPPIQRQPGKKGK